MKPIHEKGSVATEFPELRSYNSILDSIHHTLPLAQHLRPELLVSDSPVTIMDSTLVDVYRIQRSNSYKVAKEYTGRITSD